ncbi:MAG: substrate-binding domain-containing protein [Candidatus Promineifilaceae bacterium]|nr:substrate-binding domain-containing protein [Candidatus Promineifilaceae bacterium]
MAANRKITITDIAQRANVSISTVSRVLRGTTPVTQAKRKAVLEAVDELNYQPNVFARGLASGESMAVGVLTQNFGSPFYDAILQGVVQGLQGTRYFPLFADGQWRAEAEEQAILALMQRQIDGLIVIGGFLAGDQLTRYAERLPIVVVARQIPEYRENCVFIDNVQAAYKATQHLIELGHRRIAHISGRGDHPDAVDRQLGYTQALEDAGITTLPELLVEGNFRRQSGVLAVDMLMARGTTFSAIFTANDQMAYGTRLALYRRGIRVPEDISLVGFDDEPAAAYMIPPLTTVRQPALELGIEAVEVMLARLKDQPKSPAPLKAELIVRESTAMAR